MGTPLPGFDTPAVGFEQPFEMLAACHERVQRSLDLLARLLEHIDKNGHDAPSRSACADVLRYFDIAAPLHHEDEEKHVFPLLLVQGDPVLRATVGQLQDDHRRMSALWAGIREHLLRWREPGCSERVDGEVRKAVERYIATYGGHIEIEEGRVFPAARKAMDSATREKMGREMQARRHA